MQGGNLVTRVQATYSITQADLYEAQVRHAEWSFWAFQAIGVLFICVGLGSLALGQYGQAAILAMIGTFFLLRMRLAVRAAYRRDFVPAVETTVTFSDSGVEFQNVKGRSDLAWNAFVRCTETKELFMLYLQSRAFQMVPKRAFSAEDREVLRGMLQRKIGRTLVARKPDWRVVVLGLIIVAAFILVVWAVRGTKTMH